MRVHIFVRTLNDGGGGSHTNSIAYIRALREGGHDVVVHVFYHNGNAIPSDIHPILHTGFGLGHLVERAYLAKLLQQYESEADIYFLYAVEFAWGGGFYRRTGGKVPVVVYMDAYLASMRAVRLQSLSMWLYQYKRLVWDKTIGLLDARYVDRFLPCSPAIGDRYIQFGFPKDRFVVLPNIIPNTAKPQLARDTARPIVLFVGRLTHVKGADLAIEAMARVKEHKATLIIVGDGEERASIEECIAKNGIDARIIGWVPEHEVGRYYENADVYVHSARWPDPAPRTITGALQYGVPVVVPNIGGCPWLAGEAGLVYKAEDVNALAEALNQLLGSKELRAKLSAKAPTLVARFDQKVVYPQLERILLDTITQAREHTILHNV